MNPPELIVSCAIRATVQDDGTTTVEAITDGGHRPFGVHSVVPITNGFRVYHDTLEALGHALAGPDETLSLREVIPGPSAGLSYVNVLLAQRGARVPLSAMAGGTANAWVTVTGYRVPA